MKQPGDATAATGCVIEADGRDVPATVGEPLIAALARAGMAPPHLCWHPSLDVIGSCDSCLVERDGALVRACELPAASGLSVRTDSPAARAAREEALQRTLGNHELYCTLCDNNHGGCAVHNAVRDAPIRHPRYSFRGKDAARDASNPFYVYDPDQCILCGRCVEACQNLQVNETLRIDWQATRPRVLWDDGRPIGESSCVSCGHCVTVCPCNALMEKSMLGRSGTFTNMPAALERPLTRIVRGLEPLTGFGPVMQLSEADAALRRRSIRRTKTVCTYCGVGCSFDVWSRGREILKIDPQPQAPANGISTCVKGRFGFDFVTSAERLSQPLIRDGDGFREAGWDEALDHIAGRFAQLRADHGADALGFIASSKCTNEEAYLTQKFARAVIGTHNVDNCSRYCQNPATMGLFRTVGHGGDAGGIAELEQADLVLIVGSNTAESHPVLATRIKRAQKRGRMRVVVADLREHEMARRADLFLRPSGGSDLMWLQAVTRHLIDSGRHAADFIAERVNGFEAFRESLEPFTLAAAERETGIDVAQLEQLADLIAGARNFAICWAMGVTQHEGGSDTSTAISNLLLVTGHYGRPGTGAYPLRGHNNVQGTSDFGALANFLPGYAAWDDAQARARYEAGWGVRLPTTAGLNNHEMVDAIHARRLHGLYIIGEDMALVDSNSAHVEAAFRQLDFMVVQEIFLTHTARFADVVLPACPSLEKAGTFTNTERRIQRLYPALPPHGESRPDWRILTDLANRLGAGWDYPDPAAIMAEAAALTPLFAGVRHERLAGYASLQWPVAADGADTPVLYTERFAFADGKARLQPVPWQPPSERPDAEYDLLLNNGRVLEHFHEGNLSMRSPGLRERVPAVFVELSPQLARERGIEDGAWLRLVSRRGAVRVRALVSDRVRGKELYMPMHGRDDDAINRLTGDAVDRAVTTPAYKELAVRLEQIGERGERPLPRRNPRHGTPTPRPGVEVERKRSRDDYVPPPARLPRGSGL